MVLPKSFHKKLGRHLRAKRIEKNLTQVELAQLCKAGSQFISNIERGLCAPSLRVLKRIMIVLDIHQDQIADIYRAEISALLS